MNRASWVCKFTSIPREELQDELLLMLQIKIKRNPNYGIHSGKDYLLDVPTILAEYEIFESLTGIRFYMCEDDENTLEKLESLFQRSLQYDEKIAFKEKIKDYTSRAQEMDRILDNFSQNEYDSFEEFKTESNYHSFDSYPFDEKERILNEFLVMIFKINSHQSY